MKIQIHNNVWTVMLVSEKEKKMNPDEDSIYLGLTEYDKLIINIREGLAKSVTRATVIHELTHAFMFSYANYVEGEEQMCDFFGVHGDEIIALTNKIMKGQLLGI